MYLLFMQLMKALQPMSNRKKKREKKGLIFSVLNLMNNQAFFRGGTIAKAV